MKTLMSRKATVAHGALIAYLLPKLATDAAIELTPVFKGITPKNFADKHDVMISRVEKITKGKLAQDIDLEVEELATLLDAVDEVSPVETPVPAVKANDDAGDYKGKVLQFLQGKLSDEDLAACMALWDNDAGGPGAMDGDDDDEEAKRKKAAEEKKDDMVDKKAMDEAITLATTKVREDMIKTQRETRDAEEVVRPYIGKLAIACDSAAAVYRAALSGLGLKDVDKLHDDALKPILLAQPLPNAVKVAATTVAMDAASVGAFHEMFPEAKNHQVRTL